MRDGQFRDAGLGLAEVMVAMLILLIVILALITSVVLALQVTAGNGSRATASQFVQERVEEARRVASSGSCAVMEGVVVPDEVRLDGRGTPITISGEVLNRDTLGPCEVAGAGDDGDPAQIVRITVTASSDVDGVGSPAATTTTDIFMKYVAP